MGEIGNRSASSATLVGIHADFRWATITTEFIFKTGLKTASVYESMIDDQGAGLKYALEEIPETSIAYDPDDYSPWNWK